MKIVNQSQKSRKIRAQNRRKLYEKQLEKKDNTDDKTSKRKFNKNVHIYENDPDTAKITKEKSSDIARLPGQLYLKGAKCKKCGKRFSTKEAFMQHTNFSNKDKYRRRYLPRVRYVEREGVHLLCYSDKCCYHTQNLESFDTHLARKHGLLIKKDNLPIYQTVISAQNTNEMYSCPRCASTFTRKHGLKRHLEGCVGLPALLCSLCGEDFHEISDLLDHMHEVHDPPTQFRLLNEFKDKQDDVNKKILGGTSHETMRQKRIRQRSSPFKTMTKFYSKLTSIADILEDIHTFNDVKNNLKREVMSNGRIKYHLFLKVILSKPGDETGPGVRSSVIRNSIDFEAGSGTNIDKNLRECYSNLWSKAEQLAVRGENFNLFYI